MSEDIQSLTEVIAAFIVGRGLQRGQLPNAVRVAEQSLVIEALGAANGEERAHLRLRRFRYQRRRSASDVGRRVRSRTNSRMTDVIAIKLENR